MNTATTRVRVAEMLFGLGVAVVILGTVWVTREFYATPEKPVKVPTNGMSATVLHEPVTVPEFELLDQHGNRFSQASLLEQWSLLFFGYTQCPDVCPSTMNVLVQMEKHLQQDSGIEKPKYVFVSIDPDRDTPEHLAHYMVFFHPEFLGVTGTQDQLQSIAEPLGVFYQKNIRKGHENNYSINHSTAIFLVDPRGRVRALMSPPHDATVMARDYRFIVEQ